MSEMATTLGDLSIQIKIGWAIWVAWGVVVLGWYRHARVVAPMAASAAAMHAVRFTDAQSQPLVSEPLTASGQDFTDSSSTYNELNEYSETPEQH
jgi:hypothetical protein